MSGALAYFRFALLLSAAVAITAGLSLKCRALAITGGVAYLVTGLVDLCRTYVACKQFRVVETLESQPNSKIETLSGWIYNGLTIGGLAIVVATKDDKTGYAIAGWLIWGGAIVLWFVTGIVVQNVAGIPLRMGYGGWKVRGGGRRRR